MRTKNSQVAQSQMELLEMTRMFHKPAKSSWKLDFTNMMFRSLLTGFIKRMPIQDSNEDIFFSV